MTDSDPREAHKLCRYYGPKQGAECQCHATFYPARGTREAVTEAHRWPRLGSNGIVVRHAATKVAPSH